ncbi:hypothetical protein [Anditalea andensis]|uniref:Secreted protein n=1 Tax=Anditalea andensis TaxID=1048983 RepID=A0A074LKV7_9BACT|nr:hypothetical protein [Anditalea andensis]KEO74477.1 hypothetical protein EL17_06990 [Anditalea andensis]
MKNCILVCLLLMFFGSAYAQEELIMFRENLEPLCGKTFEGRLVFPAEGREPFSSNPMTMTVAHCSPDTVKIPFHVGTDRSRTWVLSFGNDGLQLKHDHRHEDGTPDEVTNYGGLSSSESTAWEVHFPADEETAAMLPRAKDNVWTMAIDRDAKIFSYILSVDGKKAVQIDFDIDLGTESGL